MSLFCVNICQYSGCGLQYASLYELIAHIEETHISSDPDYLRRQEEQTPNAVPLSYVYRVFAEPSEKRPRPLNPEPSPLKAAHQRPRHAGLHTPSASPAGFKQEVDDEGNVEESSNDGEEAGDSRITCPQPNCGKKYKNMNGMRYHHRMAHATPNGTPKTHRCPQCGKEYKTSQGLQNHVNTHQKTPTPTPPPTPAAHPPPSPNTAAAASSAAALGGHQYHQAVSPSPYQYQRQAQKAPQFQLQTATAQPTPTPPPMQPPHHQDHHF